MSATAEPCSLCGAPPAAHDDTACPMGYTPPAPPLRVWTARISYRGHDRLDITRKSAGPEGLPFAPSWAILRPALDARSQAEALRKVANAIGALPSDDANDAACKCQSDADYAQADRIEAEAWARYVHAYTAEMRASYRANVEAWRELLARREVTLCCYCADAAHCHRRLLSALLVKCGAVDCGER